MMQDNRGKVYGLNILAESISILSIYSLLFRLPSFSMLGACVCLCFCFFAAPLLYALRFSSVLLVTGNTSHTCFSPESSCFFTY